jgi:intein/homing endonuclease
MSNISTNLAEFAGIHAGDGHLHKRGNSIEISGGIEEKTYYDNYIIPLCNNLFNDNINGRHFKSKGTYGFYSTNKEMIYTLLKLGFPKGKKTHTVDIPKKIMISKNKNLKKAFIRGVFDTDGSLTFDKKIYNSSLFKKNRNYYPRLIFNSVSKSLAQSFFSLVLELKFKATIHKIKPKKKTESLKYVVQLVGYDNLEKWIAKIGISNPSKLSRYFVWKQFKHCPPYTTYEQRLAILGEKLDPETLY